MFQRPSHRGQVCHGAAWHGWRLKNNLLQKGESILKAELQRNKHGPCGPAWMVTCEQLTARSVAAEVHAVVRPYP